MKMKQRLLGFLAAGLIAVAGVPSVVQPLTADISAATTAVSGTSTKKLAAPKSFKATISGSTVKLSWKKVTGADAYRVYKLNTKTGKYETLKNTTSTSLKIKNLKAGKYKFIVAALVKNGTKYSVQTKSTILTVKITASTTTKTAALPVTFPELGTAKDAAIKAMALTDGVDAGKVAEDAYAYCGYKKIGGKDCMVLMYFTGSGKFFYGLAVIPGDAKKFSAMFSDIKTLKGKADAQMNLDNGMEFYEWIDNKSESFIGLLGSDAAGVGMYMTISMKYSPDSMKQSGSFNMDSLLAAIDKLNLT